MMNGSRAIPAVVALAALAAGWAPPAQADPKEGKEKPVTSKPSRKPGEKIDLMVFPSKDQGPPEALYANNPQVIRTDKEVALVFGVQEMARLETCGRHPHYHPVSVTHWAVSKDGGLTWRVTSRAPTLGKVLDASYGVPLPDGGMVTMTFTDPGDKPAALIQRGKLGWRPYCADLPAVKRSTLTDFGPFDHAWFHSMTRTGDGGLLAGCYTQIEKGSDRSLPLFLRSQDNGRTWKYASHIHKARGLCLSENSVLGCKDGRVLAVFRADVPGRVTQANRLYQAESNDSGRTWSEPRPLALRGHPPYLLRLSSGAILLVYGRRSPPHSVRAILSRDDGRTWDRATQRVLRVWKPGNYDLGYPQATQLDDGTILCACYGYSTGKHAGGLNPTGIFVSLFDEQWLAENGDKSLSE